MSFNKLFFAALLVIFFFSSSLTHAQRYGGGFASPGVVELGGGLTFQSTTNVTNGNTGGTTTVFSLQPYVGYFFTDGFELGFNPFGITTVEGNTSLLFLLAPSYNFRTGSIAYPFVEALLGLASASDGETRSGFTWGLRGGVKLNVVGNGNLNLGLEYLQVSLNPSGASSRYGYNQVAFNVGFTVWF
ncbi:MAG: hypothetical protein ACM3UR_03745 [Bacteroidota bacterium]|nr:hypothetical protein [Ignavibacteria bacterium]HEX2962956.1 hypothetical protein [Ignavibacteriales bacterium]MCU7498467.1 hypothetical protein [Ignavibacteria bacterium]MCU7512635.1 hypothetical protein [Ignavibacteria bacterium]MCU7521243.1 hypothetical protein [Ignavibacteria bacterium]